MFDRYYFIKTYYFGLILLRFFALFCFDFMESHGVSFSFNILDPGPNNILNNMCGARCGGSHNFLICLDNLVFSEVL